VGLVEAQAGHETGGTLMFGQPPSHMEPAIKCGLCGGSMVTKSYNAPAKFGVVMRSVDLCVRCDLTPDPPVTIHRGTN
jgi:hypothetical protein